MTSIITAVFESSDEEDADYVDSEPDSDGEENSNEEESELTLTQKLSARRRRVKLLQLFTEMGRKSRAEARHRVTVAKDDFMLRFQRPCSKPEKAKHTAQSFLHHIQIARGEGIADEVERFDIAQFKEACRCLESRGINAERCDTKKLDSLSRDVTMTKQVRYAGETVTIRKKMTKDSREYRSLLQAQEREAGTIRRGDQEVQSFDSLIAAFGKPKTITSVQKSLSDWQSFKDLAGLEDELRKNRKDGFLGRQDFLMTTEQRRDRWQQETSRKRNTSSNPALAPNTR